MGCEKSKPEFRRHTALLRFLLHFAVRLIPGPVYEVQGLGRMVTVDPPAFAVLPLISIGFCRSPQGWGSKTFRAFCCLFDPIRMLILGLLGFFGDNAGKGR